MHYTGRNIEIVPLDAARYLIAATVSSIGTGINHDDDRIVFPYLLGRMKARSLAADLLSVNAVIGVVSVTIFQEMIPQGEEILRGIRDELSTVSDAEIPVLSHFHPHEAVGKTILNMVASGTVYKEQLKIDSTQFGDFVYQLGVPRRMDEINNLDSPELAKLYCVRELATAAAVHEIIVLNGQSVLQTIDFMERTNGLNLFMGEEGLDEEELARPGFGAGCLVFSSKSRVKSRDYDGIPLQYLGRMKGGSS